MARSSEAQDTTGTGRNLRAAIPASSLIDTQGVAEVLGVTPRLIQRLVAERRIPYLKIGRFVRFDRAELSVWLDERRIEPHERCAGPDGPIL